VAQSLLNLTRDADFDIQDVVDCIERDPALAARLLRIVNSPRYGLQYPVRNLHQGVAFLGQRTLRLIAMTFSIAEVLSTGPARELYNDFWRHAVTMANATWRLCEHTDEVDSSDAYAAGLLADLGTLLLGQVETERYVRLYREKKSGADLVAAEREEYGFDHAAVSARLLEQWEFPNELTAAIREHHSDLPVVDPLAIALKASDLLADVLWIPESTSVNAACQMLAEHYSLDIDGFTELALACKDEIALEAEVYGFHLDQPIDGQALLEEASRRYSDMSLENAMDLDSLTSILDMPTGHTNVTEGPPIG